MGAVDRLASVDESASHVGVVGVGVSFKGAVTFLPSAATPEFQALFDIDRVLRCVLPVSSGRVLPRFVVHMLS